MTLTELVDYIHDELYECSPNKIMKETLRQVLEKNCGCVVDLTEKEFRGVLRMCSSDFRKYQDGNISIGYIVALLAKAIIKATELKRRKDEFNLHKM